MITNKHFIDWESETFGYGYGTGEQYTIKALKDVFRLMEKDNSYDYQVLEKELGHTIAWLMINILCKADMFEYGTSPRYGWLTPKGIAFKEFIADKSVDELYELTSVDQDYVHCYKETCNCDIACNNPLF